MEANGERSCGDGVRAARSASHAPRPLTAPRALSPLVTSHQACLSFLPSPSSRTSPGTRKRSWLALCIRPSALFSLLPSLLLVADAHLCGVAQRRLEATRPSDIRRSGEEQYAVPDARSGGGEGGTSWAE